MRSCLFLILILMLIPFVHPQRRHIRSLAGSAVRWPGVPHSQTLPKPDPERAKEAQMSSHQKVDEDDGELWYPIIDLLPPEDSEEEEGVKGSAEMLVQNKRRKTQKVFKHNPTTPATLAPRSTRIPSNFRPNLWSSEKFWKPPKEVGDLFNSGESFEMSVPLTDGQSIQIEEHTDFSEIGSGNEHPRIVHVIKSEGSPQLNVKVEEQMSNSIIPPPELIDELKKWSSEDRIKQRKLDKELRDSSNRNSVEFNSEPPKINVNSDQNFKEDKKDILPMQELKEVNESEEAQVNEGASYIEPETLSEDESGSESSEESIEQVKKTVKEVRVTEEEEVDEEESNETSDESEENDGSEIRVEAEGSEESEEEESSQELEEPSDESPERNTGQFHNSVKYMKIFRN